MIRTQLAIGFQRCGCLKILWIPADNHQVPQSQPGGRRSGVCRTFPPEGLGICHAPVDPQHWA